MKFILYIFLSKVIIIVIPAFLSQVRRLALEVLKDLFARRRIFNLFVVTLPYKSREAQCYTLVLFNAADRGTINGAQ